MALQATVDTLDDVPENVRDFYEEDGDRYRLNVQGVEFPDEVNGLKSALRKERDARKALESKLSDIPDDFDPDRYKSLLEQAEQAEEEEAAKRGEYEKLLERKEEKWQEQLSKREQEVQRLSNQLKDMLVTDEARKALEKHDAHVELLLPHVMRHIEVVDEDGKRKAVVVDERGERMIGDDGSDLTVDQYVAQLREDEQYAAGFKPSGATGGGSSGGNGAGGAHRKSISEMSEKEKVAFIDQNGLEAYMEMLRPVA